MIYSYDLKTLPKHWRDPANWPLFSTAGLPEAEVPRFEKRRKGIEALLKGSSRKAAAEIAGCSAPELGRLFTRCVTVTDEYPFVGWLGLRQNFRITPWSVRTMWDEAESSERSFVGRFIELLTDPSIRHALDEAIEGRAPMWKSGRTRIARQEVFKIFLLACAARPDGKNRYPCNSEDNQSKAKRSVYRYIDLVLKRGVKNYSIWVGHDAERRMRTGTGENTFRLATLPLDLMHGDAHSWDVIGTITIKTEDGPKRIAISRLWIVLFLDHVSGAVCGYSVGYDEQVAAVTLERGLVSTQTKWLPRKLYPPLKYVKGAALPAGNLPGMDVCNFASLKLDNFSSHYANLIQENGRKSLGFHMHFGAIGAWWTNPRLERLFGILEQHGIHVEPSSMGSGPTDPLRAKDPVQAAIDHAIEFEYIEDLVETIVTEENVRKGSGRSGMSPFEILRNHIETPSVSFLPRFGPPPHATAPRLGWLILRLRIAGSKAGGRNPYVEHQGRTYTHTKMARDWTFVDQYLTVHIRRADFYVEAFGPDGTFWGELSQNGGDSTPAPYEVAVAARRERNHSDLPDDDAIAAYRQAREAEAAKEALERPKRKSKKATKVAEIDRGLKEAARTRQNSQPRRVPEPQEDVDEDVSVDQVNDAADADSEADAQQDAREPSPSLFPQTNIFALGKLGKLGGRR